MIYFLHNLTITGKVIFMTGHFEKISKNNRYGYGRVSSSSKEQAENSPSSELISTALAAIAEFETARRKSVITKDLIKTVEKYKDLGVSVTEIARISGKSRSTIYKVLKEELGYTSNRLVKNDK